MPRSRRRVERRRGRSGRCRRRCRRARSPDRRSSAATASRPQASDQWPVQVRGRRPVEPGLGQRGAVAVAPQADRLEVLGAGDVGDAPAAGRQRGARWRAGRRPRRRAAGRATSDRRSARRRRSPAGRRAARRRSGRRSARRAVKIRPSTRLPSSCSMCCALALGVVGGVAHEDGDAAVGELALEPLHDRQGEAAEAVVGDQPDGEALAAMQAWARSFGRKPSSPATLDDAGAGLGAEACRSC